MALMLETKKYRVESSHNGAFYTVTRLADKASVFFQGDDALEFESQLMPIALEEEFDRLCSEYDEVMHIQEQ